MKIKILNYGSLNIDYVYKVPHFVRPGETLASSSLQTFSGGKGANQTVALARAKAIVFHAGKIGTEGEWLKERLKKEGVDVSYIERSTLNNGHACIQVDDQGRNAILLFPGANKTVSRSEIDSTLNHFVEGDYLLLQNEINEIDYLIKKGHQKKLHVCFNPAPMSPEVLKFPLDLVDILIVNETETNALAGTENYLEGLSKLAKQYPNTEVIVTIGEKGALYRYKEIQLKVDAYPAKVVDTTGAGDTFIGYYLAAKLEGLTTRECLEFASKASALCVSKHGAQDSIPTKKEVLETFS